MRGSQDPKLDAVVVIVDDVGPPPTTRDELREKFAKLGINGDKAIDAIARLDDRMAAGMLKLKRCLESQELKQVIEDFRRHKHAFESARVGLVLDGLGGRGLSPAAAEEEKAVRDLMLAGMGIRSASVNRIRDDLAALALQCAPTLEYAPQPKPGKSRKQQRRLPKWQRDRR